MYRHRFIKFCLAVCFAMLTIGWDTTISMSTGKTDLRAVAVNEGICLVFDNIPPETTWIFIHFTAPGERDSADGMRGIIGVYTDIRGSALEQLKKTGRIVCPFVQAGRSYNAGVYFQRGDRIDDSEWVYVRCIADRGICFNNEIDLSLNAAQTGVTLSGEPEFSAEVHFAPNKYSYSATIKTAEDWSVGIGDNKSAGGLTWDFEPGLSNELRLGDYLESGSYSAYVTAFCNLIYGSLSWSVEIAKSREFIFSL